MLISSDPEWRETIYRTLAGAGVWPLQSAHSGSAALRLLRETAVKLIVSDLELADLDGWRLVRLIRSGAISAPSDMPVVVVARSWSERIVESMAREYGVDAVLAFDDLAGLPALVQDLRTQSTRHDGRPRILVIEDSPEIRQLVERVLHARFELRICADGEIGLDAFDQEEFDLVLLDVMLPGRSGREILREIMARKPAQSVVIMTAHGTADLAEELMVAGAADFISKPFRAEELRRVCEIASRRDDFLVAHQQFAEAMKSVQESRESYRQLSETHAQLLDHLQTVVLELEPDGTLRYLNKAWERLTDIPVSEATGKNLAAFLPDRGELRVLLSQQLRVLLHSEIGAVRRFELPLQHANGDELWVECQFQLIANAAMPMVTASLLDITLRKQAQLALEHLSRHDPLTGLHNRRVFEERLRQLAQQADENGSVHALLYLDLDHFKLINETVGARTGDEVLKRVADALQHRLRRSDVLSRLGDDEFGLLLVDIGASTAERIASELCERVRALSGIIEDNLPLGCSIGIALIDGSQEDGLDYLRQADSALHVAKLRGRNRYHLFSPDDREAQDLRDSMDWTHRARRLIKEGRLELYLQPVLHIASGAVAYHEALVRLHDNERGMIMPAAFIPALERTGDTVFLDHAVITEACRLLAAHPALSRLAVNLSAHSFADQGLLPHIEASLREYEVEASRLIFELTESASLANLAATRRMAGQLASLGCELAVDDFGTGFSTFTYIKELPATCIKIDGSFIRKIVEDKVDQALVRAMSEAARALDKRTVAEFIETAEALSVVHRMGIDYAQGFFIGKPMAVADALLALRSHDS